MARASRPSRVAAAAALAALVAALTATSVASGAPAAVTAKGPSAAECTRLARQATAAAKKRFTIPRRASFNMSRNRGKNVWYIAPSLATGYALALSQGVAAAGKDAGLDLTIWDSRGLAGEMGAGISRAIADRADFIVIQAVTPTLVANQLRDAAAARIPVLSILNGLERTNLPEGITATLEPDAAKLGALQMDYALAVTKCKLSAAWFYVPSFSIQVAMTKGVLAEQRRLCPSCSVKHVTFDLPTMASRLPQQTANYALSNSKVNIYISAFDTAATFMIQGLRTAGSKAWLVGANGNPPNLDILRNGGQQIATVAYPEAGFLGWDIVDQVGRLLQNQSGARHRTIPVQAIDFTNVGKDNSIAQVFPKLVGYEAAFRRMWGS